jgi:hypothetical protein
MRFRVEGKYTRGWAVGPWTIDAPSAEAAWLQAEELGIVVVAVIPISAANDPPTTVLAKRPASLPPQAFAPSAAGVVWTTLLSVIDLCVCFLLVSVSAETAAVASAAFVLALLAAMAATEWGRYVQLYVDFRISQYHARSCLAKQGPPAEPPREQGPSDITLPPA